MVFSPLDVERRLTPSTATYCPHTGFTTLTVYGHSLEEGDFIRLEDNSLTFTCALDGNATNHTYPRSTDPAAGKFLEITDITGDEITINVGAGGTDTSAHTFVSADPNAITVKGVKSNQTADEVYLHNVKFICTEEHAGVTTDIFPDGTAPYGFVFPAISSPGVTTFTMQAGVSQFLMYSQVTLNWVSRHLTTHKTLVFVLLKLMMHITWSQMSG